MKVGDIFRVVKGGGPNHLRVGQLWELTESKWAGVQFTKDAKRNGLKHGMSTMILNGISVAVSEVRAGRIVHASPEAAPLPDKKTAALIEAGQAMDETMKQLLTTDFVSAITDTDLVDKLHRALNSVVAIVGKPWRK